MGHLYGRAQGEEAGEAPMKKPSDAELKRAYEAMCEGPGPEEARRDLYDAGFADGVAAERKRWLDFAEKQRSRRG